MEPTDAADLIAEMREEMEEDREQRVAEERFRSLTAVFIAAMAMILAVASLGGDNAGEDMIHSNIAASDLWAFYQAKTLRQTSYRLAADELELTIAGAGDSLHPDLRRRLEERLDSYRATIARYEDEPDPAAPGDSLRGEGKRQLFAQARAQEAARERSARQDGSFDYASILLQIAIVLGSVALLASSRKVLGLAVALAVAGALLTANGFLLLV